MSSIRMRACAKLNLALDVCGVREDGYHELEMIMQSVDLFDEIEVKPAEREITVECGDLSVSDNIAAVAAGRYLDAAGCKCGVHISIDKHIPVCGGLAGGSADAAAVLLALDRLIGSVDKSVLAEIAASLGADVPFAMVGGLAYVKGVGEKITPLSPLPECTFVLASGGEKDSTGRMFGRLDSLAAYPHPNTAKAVELINRGSIYSASKQFGNSFDALWLDGLAGDVRNVMRDCGALSCAVSGSGPTLFGVFPDDESATVCAQRLSSVTDCCLCHPTDKSVYFE